MGKLYFATLLFLSIAGCAESGQPGACGNGACTDGGGGGGGSADLSAAIDLSAGIDLMTAVDLTAPLKFGDPCTDKSQCESQICIFSGLGGVCSVLCPQIGCPQGYGCYGVLGGGIDPGAVVDICVPENNLLCTPCSQPSECGSPLGKDSCLSYPTGSFCGRDCSAVACPPTYTCQTLNPNDMGVIKQCVPTNNACDCTLAKTGIIIACSITTPTGSSCAGTRTCNGAQGWGTCSAPSTIDLPDDTFTDSNCDGIDGSASDAIFVDALSGNDNFAGTMAKPVLTISQGITLAQANTKSQILVSKGSYAPLNLISGAHIYGGYDAANNWQRATNNTTTISGGNPAVYGGSLTQDTRLDGFNILGMDAAGGTGQSAYAVRLVSSSGPITLHNCTIESGNATGGTNGSNGSTGAGGSKGGRGGDGCENCSSPSTAGSQGGSSCYAGGLGGGGTSGTGTAGHGDPGAGLSPGTQGSGGCGCDKSATLCATTCSCGGRCSPNTGGPGGSGGAGGNGGTASQLGMVINSLYVASNGFSGTNGSDGSSGGGGGGGGGSNGPCFCNAYTGGGGGGGGGAGCHGSLGTRGTGGGGSFAVFIVASVVNVEKCALKSGTGGNGGNGGSGGLGGGNGAGGDPGNPSADGEQGAPGGQGGSGGAAGSGSGGAGGPSFGIYGHSSTVVDSGNNFQQGIAGAASVGGSNLALGNAPGGPQGLPGTNHEE